MLESSKRISLKRLHASFRSKGMRSNREIQIEEFLLSKGYSPEHSIREYGIEFDLYLRKQHIAFEFNGIAYHFYKCNHYVKGRKPKSQTYHRDKTLLALQNGILLYHFWDYEDIASVKSNIVRLLNGEVISSVDADKNPSLVADINCILEPRWILPEKAGFMKQMFPYNTKPLCWSDRSVTVYEYYNSGYVRV